MISDLEIIKQLKRLKNVQPDSEYSAISKSILMSSKASSKDTSFEVEKNHELKKALSPITTINASTEYTEKSKHTILYRPRLGKVLTDITRQTAYSVSAVAAVIVMAVIFGGVDNFGGGSLNKDVALETQNIIKDIDIHLEEASYFAITANKTRLALGDASSSGPGHASPTIIQKEAEQLELYNPRNPEIDSLLEKAAL